MVATGKEVGRVSIRVLANATKFREDLRTILTRVERTMDATVRVQADTSPFTDSVNRAVNRANDNGVTLDVDAATLGASANIAKVARNRDVTLFVKVAKSSLVTAGTALAALSGGRALNNILGGLGRGLANLDQSLPRIAAVALAIASIGSVALSSIGSLFSLGAGLAQIGGAAAILPGLLGGALITLATLTVALKDAPNQLASLKSTFTDLGNTINDRFWSKARQPIIDFVEGTLPSLQAGFGAVAGSLGQYSANLAASFQKTFGGTLLGMFEKLGQGIDIAAGGTDSLAGIVTTLGTVGSTYIPKLATGFVNLTAQFDGFLKKAAGDGSLQKWIDNGITALGQLGSSIGSIVSIFSGISSAANAGGGGLKNLSDTLATIAGIVNGPAFQTALSTIFAGAAAGASGLSAALTPIGNLLGVLAPTIATILELAGNTVGTLVTQLAGALAGPAFAQGLSDFFTGIAAGISAIGPALPSLAVAFGTLASVLGTLAANVGPLIASTLTSLAPIFTQLFIAIEPLIPVLTAGLGTAIQALIPVIATIVTDVLPQLVAAFVTLGPVLSDAVVQLAPLISALLTQLGPILPQIADAIGVLLPQIVTLALSLQPLLSAFISFLSFALTPTQDAFKQFGDYLAGFGPIGQFFGGIVSGIGDLLSNGLLGAINFVVDAITNFGSNWSKIWDAASTTVGNAIGSVGTAINDFFTGAGQFLYDAGKSIVDGLVNGIRDSIGRAVSAAGDLMSSIADFFPHSPAKKGPFAGRGWTPNSGRAIVEGLADGIKGGVRSSNILSRTSSLMAGISARLSPVSSGMSLDGAGAAGASVNYGPTYNGPVTTTDEDALAKKSAKETARAVRRFGLDKGGIG